jgi:uncharacterized membrane protein YoaK (UPF0700 family)
VRDYLGDVRATLAPPRNSKDGVLPPLLVALTAVTGLVDAFSYLTLGHVFVANMTGNVVFLAFALAGVAGFGAADSLVAIAAFGLGAIVAARLVSRFATKRPRLLAATVAGQAVLLAVAVVLAAAGGSPVPSGYRYVLIVLLATSMGMQNASVRKLAVPDLTTTVLTLTGVAADLRHIRANRSPLVRRLSAVLAMLIGAVIGALLLKSDPAWVLALAAVLAAVAGTRYLRHPSSADPA